MTDHTDRELTPEEAEALLPELKAKTEKWLGEAKGLENEMERFLQGHELTKREAFHLSATYRELCICRRRAHFSWGDEVFSMGMTPLNPRTGEVRARCTDGTRFWKEGDESYTFEPQEDEPER